MLMVEKYGVYDLVENGWAYWHEGVSELSEQEQNRILTDERLIFEEFTGHLKEVYMYDDVDNHIIDKEKYVSGEEGRHYLLELYGYEIKKVYWRENLK